MCKKKESQGPKSYINTHALRQAITPTDTYAYKHIDVQCLLAYYYLLHARTHNSHTYVQSLAPLYMLSDTHKCTYIHSYMYTLTQLGNTTTQTQTHALSQVIFTTWGGPPSPEVNEISKSAGYVVCLGGIKCSYSVQPPRGAQDLFCMHLPLLLPSGGMFLHTECTFLSQIPVRNYDALCS